MSAFTDFISCPDAQAGLIESFNYDNLQRDATPIVEELLSPINRIGFLSNQINFRVGGKKAVEVIYGQRFLESSLAEGGLINCTTGSVDGETSKIYELGNDGYNEVRSIPVNLLQSRCEKDQFYIARLLRKMMDNILAGAETNAATFILANTGNFATDVDNGQPAGTSAYKTTQTLLANGQIADNAIGDVDFEYERNGFMNKPIVFGGEIWTKFARKVGAACCGLSGINVNEFAAQNGFIYKDARKIQTLSSNTTTAIAMAPGAVQMLQWNEFIGGDGNILYMDDSALKQGVLYYPDAKLPIPFDYSAEYVCSGTTKTWTFRLALNFDFAAMPADMYQSGDRLEGVNGIQEWRVVNP